VERANWISARTVERANWISARMYNAHCTIADLFDGRVFYDF